MIPLFSTFSNPISCFDDANSAPEWSTPYFMCHIYQKLFSGAVNISRCTAYYATHSVVCAYTGSGADFRYAFAIEDYDSVLEYIWQLTLFYPVQWQQMNVGQQGYYVYQSVTNFLFFTPYFGASQPAMLSVCFCATNHCNANMSTCIVGLNYNHTALYGVNARTPSKVPASSSSDMATTSPHGTTTTLGTGKITTVGLITTTGSNVSNTITVQSVPTTATTRGILRALKVIFELYHSLLRLFSLKKVTFPI